MCFHHGIDSGRWCRTTTASTFCFGWRLLSTFLICWNKSLDNSTFLKQISENSPREISKFWPQHHSQTKHRALPPLPPQPETASPRGCDRSTIRSTTLGSASTKTARGCPRLKKSREPAQPTTQGPGTKDRFFQKNGGTFLHGLNIIGFHLGLFNSAQKKWSYTWVTGVIIPIQGSILSTMPAPKSRFVFFLMGFNHLKQTVPTVPVKRVETLIPIFGEFPSNKKPNHLGFIENP